MATQAEMQPMPIFSSEMEPLRAQITLGEKGRIVIPAALREAMGAAPGDQLMLHLEGQELRVITREAAIRRAQERAKRLIQPGRSIVEEFLAERRAEAEAEIEERPKGASK